MSTLIRGTEQPHPAALEAMRESPYNFPDTRWAAYQNMDIGHADLGHLKFLAVVPKNTCKTAPERLPDMPDAINWRYLHVCFVDLRSGGVGNNSPRP